MKRDVAQLAGREFDVLVVGGGIYGAWTAYDAALRGFSVAIIDKGDWAGGTSSASTKLIHGGLRYLEQFRLGLVRHSLQERELLLRLAPHRIKPLRFVIPDYADTRIGRWKLRAGLMLYDVLAGGGTGSRAITRASMAADHTFLVQEGLRGGLSYTDCQTDDARFVVEIVDGASAAGAVAANYVEATELVREGKRVCGVRARDRLAQHEFDIGARMVVNTAGPWATVVDPCGPPLRLVKGVHLVMPALDSQDAYLFMTRGDRRVFFLVPWYGRTLLGTTDTDYNGNPDDVRVERRDVDYLLDEAARYIGENVWSEKHILGRFAGVRALRNDNGSNPSIVSREWRCDEPSEGLIVSFGGKYTSARADAEQLVNRIAHNLGRTDISPVTSTRPFPWSPAPGFDGWMRDAITRCEAVGLDEDTARVMADRYGSRVTDVLDLITNDARLGQRIASDLPFMRAELVTAVTDEMAMTLEDVVRRRIPLAILTHLDAALLESINAHIAPLLGTTREALHPQIHAVLDRWGPPTRL